MSALYLGRYEGSLKAKNVQWESGSASDVVSKMGFSSVNFY